MAFANRTFKWNNTSDVVAEGKLIGETSYADRAVKYTEMAIDGIKIDFYDAKNKVIHEVKKSDKVEKAHIAQVKYYLYVLHKNGIEGASAIIEYPKMRQKQVVDWEEGDREEVELWIKEVQQIIALAECPPLVKMKICKKCSYYDFCYSGEILE